MRQIIIAFAFIFASNVTVAQFANYKILLEPVLNSEWRGIQSFSYGQYDGKWLIIGGRLDGLHRRQPFASFATSSNNKHLIVIDPISLKQWSVPISSLSTDLQEQLSSTNMQFYQEGNYLYIIGGYGFSNVFNDHITYGKFTAIDVPKTINAIVNGKPFHNFFRQISDANFAVTGGHLKKIDKTFYLVGGQKFIGRYNPMGPDHGPGFMQQYTNQVRKFIIDDDGVNIKINDYKTLTDEKAFHRRDYNVLPQILPDGKEGLTLFSGVFQPIADIPYLNSVTINNNGYTINPDFAQYYNHYHSAVLPLYSQKYNEMHNVFFGGIAHYYDSLGVLVQNSDVPFVKTIASVVRDNSGKLTEYKLPIEMPSLLGASAEFIMLPNIPHYANDVIKLDSIEAKKTLIGHIYGGISSRAPNIFWINTGVESEASNQHFKVYLEKIEQPFQGILNKQSINGLQLHIYPNIDESTLTFKFNLSFSQTVSIKVIDITTNKIVLDKVFKNLIAGEQIISKSIKSLDAGKSYWVTLLVGEMEVIQKIIIEP